MSRPDHLEKTQTSDSWMVWVILVGALLVLAAVAIPQFIPAKAVKSRSSCAHALDRLDAAKAELVSRQGLHVGDELSPEDITEIYATVGQTVTCIAEGVYQLNAVGVAPTCSLGSKNEAHRVGYND